MCVYVFVCKRTPAFRRFTDFHCVRFLTIRPLTYPTVKSVRSVNAKKKTNAKEVEKNVTNKRYQSAHIAIFSVSETIRVFEWADEQWSGMNELFNWIASKRSNICMNMTKWNCLGNFNATKKKETREEYDNLKWATRNKHFVACGIQWIHSCASHKLSTCEHFECWMRMRFFCTVFSLSIHALHSTQVSDDGTHIHTRIIMDFRPHEMKEVSGVNGWRKTRDISLTMTYFVSFLLVVGRVWYMHLMHVSKGKRRKNTQERQRKRWCCRHLCYDNDRPTIWVFDISQ